MPPDFIFLNISEITLLKGPDPDCLAGEKKPSGRKNRQPAGLKKAGTGFRPVIRDARAKPAALPELHGKPAPKFRNRSNGSGRTERCSWLLASPDGAIRPVLEDDAELLQPVPCGIGSLPVLAASCVIALLHKSLDLSVAALTA